MHNHYNGLKTTLLFSGISEFVKVDEASGC